MESKQINPQNRNYKELQSQSQLYHQGIFIHHINEGSLQYLVVIKLMNLKTIPSKEKKACTLRID